MISDPHAIDAALIRAWNDHFPRGTPVLRVCHDGRTVTTVTASKAWRGPLGPVVSVITYRGGVRTIAMRQLLPVATAGTPETERPPGSLCLECGPNVPVDEYGCCPTCGRDAIGPWLEKVRVKP